jgi:hypothetical protein
MLTDTAQALTTTPQSLATFSDFFGVVIQDFGTNWHSALVFLVSALMGAAFTPFAKSVESNLISKNSNLLVRTFGTPLLGLVIAGFVTAAGKTFGVTPSEAAVAFTSFMALVHSQYIKGIVNEVVAIFKASGAQLPGVIGLAETVLPEVAAATGNPALVAAAAEVARLQTALNAAKAVQAAVVTAPKQ